MSQISNTLANQSVEPEEVAHRIVIACDNAISQASKDQLPATDADTPGLEDFLWQLWNDVLDTAQSSDVGQPRLVEIVRLLKGATHHNTTWRIWGAETDWKELPLLGPQARERYNGPSPNANLSDPTVQAFLAGERPDPSKPDLVAVYNDSERWINLNHFLARLYASVVWDFGLYGIWSMRAALEGGGDDSLGPESLRIEIAAVWIVIAGKTMYESKEKYEESGKGGPLWKGANGYSRERWAFWKKQFEEYQQQPNIADWASKAIEVWSSITHNIYRTESFIKRALVKMKEVESS